MTRKDYVLIAAALYQAREDVKANEPRELHRDLLDGISYAADWLADVLARENPRFDRERFIRATLGGI